MTSQFFGLNIAASGLRAANAAMNTTANNISNANTDGYTRQRVEQEASPALRVFTAYGCAGAGVDTIAIERIRDEFYDTRYRNNEQLKGEYKQKHYYSSLVEQYMNDDGTTGFNSVFSRMKATLESVMTASGTPTTKATYIASVSEICSYFNTMNANLRNLQEDLNSEVKTTCDAINSIAEEITKLNEQINTVEMTGSRANDLRDKRDSLVDDLSEYISVKVKESPIIDENDPNRETGATRFEVWVAGGQNLLDTYNYNKLACIAREPDESVNQNDIDGLYEIKWVRSNYEEGSGRFIGTFDLDNANIGGKLWGTLQMRDGNNQKFFNGTSGLWDLNTATLTVKISDGYLKDMAQCAMPPQGQITVGTRTYEYDSWTYDGEDSYTFKLDTTNDKTGLPTDFSRLRTGLNDSVYIGRSVDYQGIPYYMEQMNEWIRNFSSAVNDIMANGFTADSANGCYMMTGNRTIQTNTSPSQYTYEDLTTTNYGYYFLTSRNFSVYSPLLKDATLMSTKADKTEGADEFGTIKALNEMFRDKEVFRGAASGEFLDKVLSDAALNTSNSRTMEETYTSLELTIGNQRLSIMGVDSDEEAANLVKFQNAYQLSSKVIQTLTEVYDRLIRETGV